MGGWGVRHTIQLASSGSQFTSRSSAQQYMPLIYLAGASIQHFPRCRRRPQNVADWMRTRDLHLLLLLLRLHLVLLLLRLLRLYRDRLYGHDPGAAAAERPTAYMHATDWAGAWRSSRCHPRAAVDSDCRGRWRRRCEGACGGGGGAAVHPQGAALHDMVDAKRALLDLSLMGGNHCIIWSLVSMELM